ARLLRLDGCSVLVHCSDGWDRTPQICSTVELLLDPHYRTLEGFCSLIEKEWLSYGHKVGVRTGWRLLFREYAELSPVFLQFLDLVHNLLAQFPTAFEISEGLLTFVAEHAFRC
ncbi:unnamed protein product, partial [Ectocarpus sp. 12 AP-2014]